MKKIKLILIMTLAIFTCNIKVYAASTSLSVSSDTVSVGDTFTVSANMKDAAAWNIYVTSSGPVNGCTISQVDASADALDTSKTFSATCTATEEGTITLTLSGDVTSAEDGNAVNVSGTKTITVVKKTTPPPSEEKPAITLSTNNKLKELKVEGYELEKKDENNYTLTVTNDIESIKVKAEAEDEKAKVTGDGEHKLQIGENNIEIIVTSESGKENKININVTRKEGYYLDDLDLAIKYTNENEINIIIDSDSKVSSQNLTKIKNSKKTVKLKYYNEDKKLMYSWILEGTKINDFEELVTKISYETDNKKEISKLSNYAEGIYVKLEQEEKIPEGTKVKIFVGDKYSDNELINVYYYNKGNNKLELVKINIKVESGYIEFEPANGTDYFLTMSKINTESVITTSKDGFGLNNIIIIILIIIIIILLTISLIIIFKLKGKNNKKTENDINTTDINNNINNDLSLNDTNNIDTNQSNMYPVYDNVSVNLVNNANTENIDNSVLNNNSLNNNYVDVNKEYNNVNTETDNNKYNNVKFF